MKRSLALVESSASPAVDVEALRVLARALAPYMRQELQLEDREGEQLVDVASHCPLSRRVLFGACRRGEIAGATKRGRRWLATRAAIDVWLRAGGPRLVSPTAEDEDQGDELEELRQELARPSRRRRSTAT